MFLNLLKFDSFKQRLIVLYSFLFFFLISSSIILIDRSKAFPVLLSLGTLAFFFGIKHALDADHIAAIDNTTRKLMNEGEKPIAVGFFFSLGHSFSIFFLTFATVAIGSYFAKNYPGLSSVANIIGTGASALFLYLIALMNIVILISIVKIAKDFKNYKNKKLEEELLKRGFMYRYFHKLMKLITSSWQMFFVGIIFGLGFDTATEIAILSISATFVLSGHPLIDVFILPLIFASGMMLLDSTDGVVMQYAYGWAFLNPVRKIFYNLTITSISVFLALIIGTLEWLQIIGSEFKLNGQPWKFFNAVSFSILGGIIAGTLISAWFISLLIYKFAKIEENYNYNEKEEI